MKCLCFSVIIAYFTCLAASNYSPTPLSEPAFIRQYLEGLKESGFNKNILPEGNNGHGSPVEVRCSMYLLDVYKVNDFNMDYVADFYFRQSWNDSRLEYTDKDISVIILNDAEKIWTPDLFFVQERKGIHHNLISPNTFIRIKPEGEVLYSVRLSLTLSCPMDFSKYPHDVQKCTFSAESYGRTRDKIKPVWIARDPVQYNKDINILPFMVTDVQGDTRTVTIQYDHSTKTYQAVDVTLTLQRKVGLYVTRLYIPFIFLVTITWMSFWIPHKMISLRLPLLLVILYLMVNIGSGISSYVPPTSYVKGSDVWIAVCESLVFATFLQFIAVYIIARNSEKLRKRICKNDPEAQKVLDAEIKMNAVNNGISDANIVACRLKNDDQLPKRIDKMCGIIFPVLFLIFNFIYWLVYCTGN